VTHVVGDQSTDGVEILLVRILQRIGDASTPNASLTRSSGVSPLTRKVRSARPIDIALVFVDVKLVVNFADDLLEHIFNRDQAGGTAEFVNDDRQVVAVAPKFTQQVVEPLAFRDEGGRSQQGADVELRCSLQLEQVLGHEDADDVLFFALVDTGKRECAVSITRLQQFVVGPEAMSIKSMRGAATMTSPAVMSARRITPSSIVRDSLR
jgi:hypothetical protein